MHYKIPVLFFFLCFSIALFAEGTKQLKPDSTKNCDIVFQPADWLYPCTGVESCDSLHKLYVRVGSASEKVYIGLKTYWGYGVFRIKLGPTTVFGPVTINNGSAGWIDYYSQAYAGPDVLDPHGYMAVVFSPPGPGDYSIDFDQGYFPILDVTVIDELIVPKAAIEGRLYTRDWHLTTSSIAVPSGMFMATQYILTDDSVVTSIYYNEMRGHNFDITTTRNGCYPPPVPWDSSCRSDTGNHHYAQYRIFLNDPDPFQFPTGILGTIEHSSITTTPHCDGSVSISFSVNKPGIVKILLDIDPAPGMQPVDVILMDTVSAGPNTIVWDGFDGLGHPVPDKATVNIKLTYVNGLTNLALFDVEKHLKGFVIRQVRPYSDSIATYWNDTLLASQGGTLQLAGCYSALPDIGCHTWDGNYGGIGIGSMNTVNTWWYATSSINDLTPVIITRVPDSVLAVIGPTTVCNAGVATYTAYPDPLPAGDTDGYEWVLTQASTNQVLIDSTGTGSVFTIHFSGLPMGQKYLKVRGTNATCGPGPFGPGNGILIDILPSPSITNPVNSSSMCSGDTTDLLIQLSPPTASITYTASATSPDVSGYSGGNQNPIEQVLTTTGTGTDSVIYRVVPFNGICPGDTTLFYARVSPVPVVTNVQTGFEQCSGLTTNLPLTGNVPDVFFNWTATASSPDISGYSDGTGPVIAQLLVNSGPVPGTVTYVVTPDLNGCQGIPKSFVFTVNPSFAVSVSIVASENPFCLGTPVTFTATPTNGGTIPQFQWQVNGVNVGINDPVCTYIPASLDLVSCILTSSEICTTNNPDTSAQITMIGFPGLPADVTIAASPSPSCPGVPVTFTATPINGGSNPTYQWQVNGTNVGNNNSIYSYIPASLDLVSCIMTSNLPCVSNNPVFSPPSSVSISPTPVVTFTACFDTITTTNAKPIRLKGGIPLGGTYTGPGVSGGYFYPNLAGVGTHVITYTYTNSALCSNSSISRIHESTNPIFNCGSALIDIRDGKIYPTVQIGSQCWFAADLNVGIEIPPTIHQRDNCVNEKYFNPASSIQHPASVYQWDELMCYDPTPANQGLCPPGWHVPTETEWNILFANWTNNAFAGSQLKYSGYSGFNAVLSGVDHLNRQWDFNNFATFFWSSTSLGPYKAWSHGMNEYDPSVSVYPSLRTNAFFVRCLKD